jgi:lysozyme
MQPRHRVSRTAIELIERFEGYRRKAAQLPDGRWVIGHGHTLTARQGAEVSQADAEALLLYDLIAVAHGLNEQVYAPLTQNQFDALASFVFNIGLDNFSRSGVRRRLNEGAPILAACAMELWRKADVGGTRIVVDALVRRRAAERALFLTPDDGDWLAAPSHILSPRIDGDAVDVVPFETPAAVVAVIDGEAVRLRREGELAPPPADPDDAGPVKAAAEAVTARLSTIFADPGVEPGPAPSFPASSPAAAEPEPFFLSPPDLDEALADDEPDVEAEPLVEGPPGRDLFAIEPLTAAEPRLPEAEAPGAEAPRAETPESDAPAAEGPAWPGPPLEPEERRIIDDAAPYDDFDAPLVSPSPEPAEGGALTLVALAVLGLVFFGGGVFWATDARPAAGQAWLEPRVVGWLAGIAGVLFFAIAVYLLLQRLGRASEREARRRT